MKWEVPEIWPDATVYIIGGGPSVNDFDLSRLQGQGVIATNSAFEEVPFAQFLCFTDREWWENNRFKLANFPGVMVTRNPLFRESRRVKFLEPSSVSGLETRPGYINYAANTGLWATFLAIKLGASQVVLVGFDCQPVNGRTNYHDRHSNPGDSRIYQKFLREWDKFSNTLLGYADIINACPTSAITNFRKVNPNAL